MLNVKVHVWLLHCVTVVYIEHVDLQLMEASSHVLRCIHHTLIYLICILLCSGIHTMVRVPQLFHFEKYSAVHFKFYGILTGLTKHI